ncbi:MAG: type I-E CRISPR-associated protein Cas7/Cse4/CasC [Blastocatellales bacterium]|nr:type I-E CRISPR-associated protein Cas7/Cse4/CasC [Blastocatellales bacterium]
MIIELHILQNFAPANLNRDDTGSPKDCEFGGHRRARISSQCFKRAIRQAFDHQRLINPAHLASRTKRLVDEITSRLKAAGKMENDARRVVENILNGVKLTVKDDGKTQYLLFLGADEINAIAGLCEQHWETLAAIVAAPAGEESGGKKTKAKDAKKAGADAIPPEIKKATLEVLNGGKAADLALFGRMLADLPDKNVHAASQVAHAISTNKVSMEFDFYTAVDDLKPDDNQGSDMLGTVEFNSACYYRYSNLDVEQLKTNLGGDAELANKTIEAFIRAAVTAIPTGKQNSMAAHNPPSFVMAVVREAGLWSLANAFVNPIRPNREGDLIDNSIKALDAYWSELTQMYGDGQIKGRWVASLAPNGLANLKEAKVKNLPELVNRVMSQLNT